MNSRVDYPEALREKYRYYIQGTVFGFNSMILFVCVITALITKETDDFMRYILSRFMDHL